MEQAGGLTEDTDPARTNQQTDHDEDDAPQDLSAEERHDAGHDQYDCQNPKKKTQHDY